MSKIKRRPTSALREVVQGQPSHIKGISEDFLDTYNPIVNQTFGHIEIENGTVLSSLHFIDCTFESIKINKIELAKNFILERCEVKMQVNLTDGHFEGLLKFKDCDLNGTLVISQLQISGETSIINSNFNNNTYIEGKLKSIFKIENSNFAGKFEISNSIMYGGMTFEYGSFHKRISLSSLYVFKYLRISGGKYTDILEISGGNYSEIQIIKGHFHAIFISNIHARSLIFGKIELNNRLCVENINIPKTDSRGTELTEQREDGVKEVEESEALIFEAVEVAISIVEVIAHFRGEAIEKTQKEEIFEDNKCSILLKTFRVDGTLQLININTDIRKVHLYIINSTLQKAEFIGCKFQDAKLLVKNSIISEIVYVNSKFPKKILTDYDKSESDQLVDTYSQLRTASTRQNDREMSLYFQRMTNESIYKTKRYYKITNTPQVPMGIIDFVFSHKLLGYISPKKYFFYYSQPHHNDPLGWFQLLLNKYTNDFGQSYAKAVIAFLLCTTILFIGYAIAIDPLLELSTNPLSWESGVRYFFKEHASNYFYFINPLRKAGFLCDTIDCSKPHWLTGFWDYLSRIIIFYLTYQFIAAFRKYGKV